jgi:hypothetical protein
VSQSLAVDFRGRVAPAAIAIGIAALLFTWPAFYNGYPLLPYDGAHPGMIGTHAVPRAQSGFYEPIAALNRVRMGLWPIVFAQSAIAAHCLYLIARVTCGTVHAGSYLMVMAALAFGSSLPWFASLIAPDFLLSIIVLGMFLLAFAGDRLAWIERLYVFLLTTAATAAHPSHLPVAAGLLLVVLILKFALGPSSRSRILASILIAGPLSLAVAAHLAANHHARHEVASPTLSPIVLLGRMIEDGTAVSYLRDACPQRRYALCDYLEELPQTSAALLWEDGAVIDKAGGNRLHDEASEIVAGTLAAYPLGQLSSGIINAAEQFVTFEADDWLSLGNPRRRAAARPVGQELSGDGSAYSTSRQAKQTLPIATVTIWHTFSALFGMTVSAFLFIEYCRRGDRDMIALFLVILTALVVNAFVIGSLSVVQGRFQSRLAWLAVLYAVMAAHHFYLCHPTETRREA